MKMEKKMARLEEKQRKMKMEIKKNRRETLKFLEKICKIGYDTSDITIANKLIHIGEQVDKALSK